ncbi:YlbF family regulator [Paucilactobacillus sp. N302-9]
MVVNIYDSANQMEKDLGQTQEFVALKKAYEEMKADADTFKLFKEFQQMQLQLQQKQFQGEQPSEEEVKNAQELAGKVTKVDSIKNLMEKEQAIDKLLNDVNNVITKPIQELYQN